MSSEDESSPPLVSGSDMDESTEEILNDLSPQEEQQLTAILGEEPNSEKKDLSSSPPKLKVDSSFDSPISKSSSSSSSSFLPQDGPGVLKKIKAQSLKKILPSLSSKSISIPSVPQSSSPEKETPLKRKRAPPKKKAKVSEDGHSLDLLMEELRKRDALLQDSTKTLKSLKKNQERKKRKKQFVRKEIAPIQAELQKLKEWVAVGETHSGKTIWGNLVNATRNLP